jgi:hypothetical protein
MAIHIFAGPTIRHDEIRRYLDNATIHAPVKLGDLLRLELRAGDIVLILDGLFHQELPVRHKEILNAISDGASVIGASSMGALRAAELHQYGMIGIGSIFEMYRDGIIDADDEVAVTHGPPPDWRVLSEALINIRHAVQLGAGKSIIPGSHVERIVNVARRLPYPQRTWPMIESESALLGGQLGESVAAVREFLATHPAAGDLKRQDARRAIDAINQGTFAPTQGVDLSWKTKSEWRTIHLARWVAEFRRPSTSAAQGSRLAVFHYQQIYDADFPRRWERYVLRRIVQSASQAPPTHLSLRDQALSVATHPELGLELLAENRKAEWLTAEELAYCSNDELMIRVLVRSSSKPSNFAATAFDEGGLLVGVPHTEAAIAEAREINRKATKISFTMHIENLKTAILGSHLLEVWGGTPNWGERHLMAAARDRGFASIHEAADAVRPFYLKNTAHALPTTTAHET